MTGELARQFKQVFEAREVDDFEVPSADDIAELIDEDLDADREDDNLFDDVDDD